MNELRSVIPFGEPVTVEVVYDEAVDSYSLVVGGVEATAWTYQGPESREAFERAVTMAHQAAVAAAGRMAALAAWSMIPEARLTREAGALGGPLAS